MATFELGIPKLIRGAMRIAMRSKHRNPGPRALAGKKIRDPTKKMAPRIAIEILVKDKTLSLPGIGCNEE